MSGPAESAAIVPPERAFLAAPDAPQGIVDRLVSWAGDRVNPILVKETRQALKSRQFTITFSLVLICGWGWSMLGPAMLGPEIRYIPKGTEMFLGYYILVAFPLLVIVPFGAMRSLLGELEERTYELISISTLNPRQIISGKLASTGLQMLIYLSAITPCLAFTYLLRGIDILTILMPVLITALASLGLSAACLLMATLSTEKHWQVVLSVIVVIGLLLAWWAAVVFSISTVEYAGSEFSQPEFWHGLAIFLANYAGHFLLVFYAAAARLTFPSENRSTRLRAIMLLEHAILVGSIAWYWLGPGLREPAWLGLLVILLGLHWYVLGALMTCESPALSLRVRRRLPQSFLGRALGTWFNPGPGTGYVFAVSGMLGLMLVAWIGARFDSLAAPAVVTAGPRGLSSVKGPYVVGTAVLMLSYVTFYLGLGLLLIRFVRRFTPVGMLLGVLLHVVLVVAGTLLPLVIQLSSPTLYHEVYSLLQITNPFWTIGCAIAHWTILSGYDEVWVLVPLLAILVFCANLPGAARELRAVRVAQPRRVAEEDAALAAPREPVRTGPWDA